MKLLDQVDLVGRRRGLAEATRESYSAWIDRYLRFSKARHGRWRTPEELGTEDAEAFLNHLVGEKHLSASSQNQARNALVFLYKQVLENTIPHGGGGELRGGAPRDGAGHRARRTACRERASADHGMRGASRREIGESKRCFLGSHVEDTATGDGVVASQAGEAGPAEVVLTQEVGEAATQAVVILPEAEGAASEQVVIKADDEDAASALCAIPPALGDITPADVVIPPALGDITPSDVGIPSVLGDITPADVVIPSALAGIAPAPPNITSANVVITKTIGETAKLRAGTAVKCRGGREANGAGPSAVWEVRCYWRWVVIVAVSGDRL